VVFDYDTVLGDPAYHSQHHWHVCQCLSVQLCCFSHGTEINSFQPIVTRDVTHSRWRQWRHFTQKSVAT